jgi:hypothetical protein
MAKISKAERNQRAYAALIAARAICAKRNANEPGQWVVKGHSGAPYWTCERRAPLALAHRIARIASPPVIELAARRNAKFGRLNVAAAFDLQAHVRRTEQRSDIRAEFARRVRGAV